MKNMVKVGSIAQFKNLIDVAGLPEEAELIRKQYVPEIAIDDTDERTVVGKISTIDEDRDGDIVMPDGMSMDRFARNPVVLVQHNYSELPIGRATKIAVTDSGIIAKTKFASTKKGKEVYQLFKEGILRAFSIGFVINKSVVRGTDAFKQFVAERKLSIGEGVRRIITQSELLEYSCVNIPCNQYALVMQVSEKQAGMDFTSLKTDLIVASGGIPIAEKDVDEFVTKPMAGWHSARQRDPGLFDPNTFWTVVNDFARGQNTIYGKLKGSDSRMTIQTRRFDAKLWTEAKAKEWCKEHDYSISQFEPAKPEPDKALSTIEVTLPKDIMVHTDLDFGKKADEPAVVPAVVPAVDPAPVQPTPAVQPTPVWNVVRSGSAVSTMTDAQAQDIARAKKSGRVV